MPVGRSVAGHPIQVTLEVGCTMPLLFSYGTLQSPGVQLATFGRQPVCAPDRLPGYALTQVPITDPQRAVVHRASHYANVVATGTLTHQVAGMLLEITEDELALTDGYEALDGYTRIAARLASGRQAWLYVANAARSVERSRDE
jgi:gamma-glutamylcyclotransferase (GGCT)/AIG2-like uncharacterized protein YtfP